MTKELKGPGFHFDVHTDLRADQKAEVLIEALPWLEEFAGQRIDDKTRVEIWGEVHNDPLRKDLHLDVKRLSVLR